MARMNGGFRRRANYLLDQYSGRLSLYLIIGVLGAALAMILVTPLLWLLRSVVDGDVAASEIPQLYWTNLVTVLGVGGGEGSWAVQVGAVLIGFLAIYFWGYIFASIYGYILVQQERIAQRGGQIVAQNHTVIIGWSAMSGEVLAELAIANENQKRPYIAILASQPRQEVEAEVAKVECLNTKVVVRSGDPLDPSSFDLVALEAASKVVVVGTWNSDGYDDQVIAILLSLSRFADERTIRAPIVACTIEPGNVDIAREAAPPGSVILEVGGLVSKIKLQASLEPGVMEVYTDLYSFDGSEMYFVREPKLVGHSIRASLLQYPDSCVIGLRRGEDVTILPDLDTVIGEGDELLVITEDDDTAIVAGTVAYDAESLAPVNPTPTPVPVDRPAKQKRRWIFVGIPGDYEAILNEMDGLREYENEVVIYVPFDEVDSVARDHPQGAHRSLVHLRGFQSDAAAEIRDELADGVDHIVISRIESMGDAGSIRLLLRLGLVTRGLPAGQQPTIVTEVLDERYLRLSRTGGSVEVIVGSLLVAGILAQLCEDPGLLPVVEGLARSEGAEFHLKPADGYVVSGSNATFATVVEAAARRGEIAVGYWLDRGSAAVGAPAGLKLNPHKSVEVSLGHRDRVVVLAQDTT